MPNDAKRGRKPERAASALLATHPKPSFLLSRGCVLENFSMSA